MGYLGGRSRYTFFVSLKKYSHFLRIAPPPLKNPRNVTESTGDKFFLFLWVQVPPELLGFKFEQRCSI